MAERVPQCRVGLAVHQRRAFVGGVEAEDHPHGGGLARAVGPDESGDLSRCDPKRDPIQGDGGPEPLVQSHDFYGRFHTKRRYEGGPSLSSRCGAIF